MNRCKMELLPDRSPSCSGTGTIALPGGAHVYCDCPAGSEAKREDERSHDPGKTVPRMAECAIGMYVTPGLDPASRTMLMYALAGRL